MEVKVESFCMWTLELSDVAIGSKMQRHKVRVAPALFSAKHYTNESRYLPEDENSMEIRRLKPWGASKSFRAAAVKSREDCKKQQALRVVTLRNIRAGGKLFVDYSIK